MDDLVERLRTAVTYGYMPRRMREVADEAAARITALEAQLAAVLDVADEAYRKYCGQEFDGFDADDTAVLQAARTYWWGTCGQSAIASGAYKEQPND